MPNQCSGQDATDPWMDGYEAAIQDVIELLDQFDIRRTSLTAPLLLGFRANVEDLKASRNSKAA